MQSPTKLWAPSPRQTPHRATARRFAGLLGFCLPFSGGVDLERWIPGYPGPATVIRLVTVLALVWVISHPATTPLPTACRRLLQVFVAVVAYGAITLLWAPDASEALHDLITITFALSTAAAVILLVRADRGALRCLAAGILAAGALNVAIAAVEVATGLHLSNAFGAGLVAERGLASVEALVGGPVAWGSMGNPNDLGGLWLLCTAVLLSTRAYGLVLRDWVRLLSWVMLGISIVIGLTAMADARAYRLGLVILIAMRLMDAFIPPGNPVRVPAVLLTGATVSAAALWYGGSLLAVSMQSGESDALRLRLLSEGASQALLSGGFGRGLGTERVMIDAGEIPLNFHNVVILLAAELGLIVAAAFLLYLTVFLVTWAFATRSAMAIGARAAFARAALAAALLVYGVTSSGVLASPLYWSFFALTAIVTGVHADRRPVEKSSDRPGVKAWWHPPAGGREMADHARAGRTPGLV